MTELTIEQREFWKGWCREDMMIADCALVDQIQQLMILMQTEEEDGEEEEGEDEELVKWQAGFTLHGRTRRPKRRNYTW